MAENLLDDDRFRDALGAYEGILAGRDGQTDQGAAHREVVAIVEGIFPGFRAALEAYVDAQENTVKRIKDGDMIRKDGGRPEWYSGAKTRIGEWPAYRRRLEQGGLPADAVESIHRSTDRILRQCANPRAVGDRRKGLVIGYVQSGKTANFTGLIAKAVDEGYRIIIVLAGMYTNLRVQTQLRLQKDLGIDIVEERSGLAWRRFTSRNADMGKDSGPGVLSSTSNVALMVVKKHEMRLANVTKFLESIPEATLNRRPVMIIDDESDQATPNTLGAKDLVSTINKRIRALWAAVPTGTYVAYTATPFANVFIDPSDAGDLYPEDFVSVFAEARQLHGLRALLRRRSDRRQRRGRGDPSARPRGAGARSPDLHTTAEEDRRVLPRDDADARRRDPLVHPRHRDPGAPHLEVPGLLDAGPHLPARPSPPADQGGHLRIHLRRRPGHRRPGGGVPLGLRGGEGPCGVAARLRGDARVGGSVARREEGPRRCRRQDRQRGVRRSPRLRPGLHADGDRRRRRHPLPRPDARGARRLVLPAIEQHLRHAAADGPLVRLPPRLCRPSPGLDGARVARRVRAPRDGREAAPRRGRRDGEGGAHPREFAIKVKSHPGRLEITSKGKMEAARLARAGLGGTRRQTIYLDKSVAGRERALEASSGLVRRAIEIGRPVLARGAHSSRRTSTLMYQGLTNADLLAFLEQYWVSPTDRWLRPEGMASWLGRHGGDAEWNLVLVSGSSKSDHEYAPGVTVQASRRAPLKSKNWSASTLGVALPDDAEIVNIRALMAGDDYMLDLRILADNGELDEEDLKVLDGVDKRKVSAVKAARSLIRPGQGAILLYAVDGQSEPAKDSQTRTSMDADGTIIGLGVVFPHAEDEDPEEYWSVELEEQDAEAEAAVARDEEGDYVRNEES
ncbi:hypothetical protein [Brachybacterium sp. GPGPB12]|uniref:hypothetical protein n=1 Tax=Brachybacterium sp. GPGPB12 TaxID=3023517 RepID=UPI0031344DDE